MSPLPNRTAGLLALTLALASTASALASVDDPPAGVVTRSTFDQSAIFPGTTRDYWVYVPAQYDPETPACLYVNQDGVQFNAPKVFDRLIADGQMPVTIGVFVQPGRVPAPTEDALDRYNRSFEYDGLGDRYARFLVEELLPEIESGTTEDGRPIRFSKDPDDRAIGGASSGAIAAFTAAWERPDQFRRVFSSIGTYVGLRGGDGYPTLIRKTEPKPLRVFLEDGTGDLNIYGGDWWMANQTMERALTFAGYEVEHNWGEGGHSPEHATAIFPDAMRWLWNDLSEPIQAGAGSPPLQEIVEPGSDWELVQDGLSVPGGIAANPSGEVFFSDFNQGRIYRVGLDGEVKPVEGPTQKVGGMAFGPDGTRYDADLATIEISNFEGPDGLTKISTPLPLGSLVVDHDGNRYEIVTGINRPSHLTLKKGDGEPEVLLRDAPLLASGVTLSPDQSLLYVSYRDHRWVTSSQIRTDGTLADTQDYFYLHVKDGASGPEAGGLAVDRDGRLYVATALGVQVCDQPGRVNAILPLPSGRVVDLCIGGPDFQTLYAVGEDRCVYRRPLKVRGANGFEPPSKPARPKL